MSRATAGLAAGLVVMALVMLTGPNQQSDLWLFVGRWHPTVVHLPIGILLLAVGFELAGRTGRFPILGPLIPVLLYLGALAAIVAATAGLLLANWGGYPAGTLFWHRWIGVAVAIAASLLYSRRRRGDFGRGYHGGLALLGAGLVIGGHLGGTLTHGVGYLTEHLPDGVRRIAGLVPKDQLARLAVTNLDTVSAYQALIQPIFDRRCSGCHNAERKKGGLTLASFEGLMAGGKDGKVVVAGRPDQSEMIVRLWLPPGHKDRMPPDRAIPIAEAELLRWWIEQGAPAEARLAEIDRPARIDRLLDDFGLADLPTGIFTLAVPAADSTALAAVRAAGFVVRPLAGNTRYLDVDARAAAGRLAQLEPVAALVAWLDLSGTDVADSTVAPLSRFPHLTRLHLERTRVTDRTLDGLRDLQYLEYLNLYGTQVTDAGLRSLGGLRRLKALFAWETRVTRAGADSLKRVLPRVTIDLGADAVADTARPR